MCKQLGIIAYHRDILTPEERSAGPVIPCLGGKDPGVENQNQHDGAREEASKDRNDRVGEIEQGPSDTAGDNKWWAETKTSGSGTEAEDPGIKMQVHSAEEEKGRSRASNHQRVLPHTNHTTKTQTCEASVTEHGNLGKGKLSRSSKSRTHPGNQRGEPAARRKIYSGGLKMPVR